MSYPTYKEWLSVVQGQEDFFGLSISEHEYNREVKQCKAADARLAYFNRNGFPKPKEKKNVEMGIS